MTDRFEEIDDCDENPENSSSTASGDKANAGDGLFLLRMAE